MVRRPEPSSNALLRVTLSVFPVYNQIIKPKLCPLRDVNLIPREGPQWCVMISMDRARVYLCFPCDVEIPYALRNSSSGSPSLDFLRQYAYCVFTLILPR